MNPFETAKQRATPFLGTKPPFDKLLLAAGDVIASNGGEVVHVRVPVQSGRTSQIPEGVLNTLAFATKNFAQPAVVETLHLRKACEKLLVDKKRPVLVSFFGSASAGGFKLRVVAGGTVNTPISMYLPAQITDDRVGSKGVWNVERLRRLAALAEDCGEDIINLEFIRPTPERPIPGGLSRLIARFNAPPTLYVCAESRLPGSLTAVKEPTR